jgi:hypothetical protein
MGKRVSGKVVVEGDAGTEVPLGTVLVRKDGTKYATTREAEVEKGDQVHVDVEALVDGDAAACSSGTPLEFETELEGLDGQATVDIEGLLVPNAGGGKKDDKGADKKGADKAAPAGPKLRHWLRAVVNGEGSIRAPCEVLKKDKSGYKVKAKYRGRTFEFDGLPEFVLGRTEPSASCVEVETVEE